MTLAEPAVLVLRLHLLLALDDENAVRKLDFDVLLDKARKVGADFQLAVGLIQLKAGPAGPTGMPARPSERAAAEGREVEPTEHFVEHAIHLAMQGRERVEVFAAPDGHVATTVPGDDISESHV